MGTDELIGPVVFCEGGGATGCTPGDAGVVSRLRRTGAPAVSLVDVDGDAETARTEGSDEGAVFCAPT